MGGRNGSSPMGHRGADRLSRAGHNSCNHPDHIGQGIAAEEAMILLRRRGKYCLQVVDKIAIAILVVLMTVALSS